MLLIGVDVGGTFTDIVLTDSDGGHTHIHKVMSVPRDPSVAIMKGVTEICERAGVAAKDIDHIYHGTTVATNAVLEYKGATVGMITTAGFRDVVHIGRHQRPQHYSIQQDIPWQTRPLARRRHRLTVSERVISPKGEVLTPLDKREVRKAAIRLRDAGVEAVAVCFLFSYLNPGHERVARSIVQEVLPDAFVTCSHEVSPQFREFERFTTALLNAFIGPLVSQYLNNLERALRSAGFRAELHIMRSNGGVASVRTLLELPVFTLLSGPAAGVLGGAWIADLVKRKKIITLDIGGTSADIGVISDGRFAEATARDTEIAGYPVLVPMIDLHTIGAGGGSIAHIDEANTFQVGPQSAGADPGPAAYGRGGAAPTVTDANIVLGRLDTTSFLGGAMPLDEKAAHAAVAGLGERLGLSLMEAAEGIVTLVNSNMANAIRARTIQKGIDPREYSLVAFGGAGPLHGAEVAKLLRIPEVVVPPYPGINSAIGLLTTDLKYDSVRTAFLTSAEMDVDRLNAMLEEMEAQLKAQFHADGVAESETTYERHVDARYLGQGYELRVPLAPGRIHEQDIAAVVQAFNKTHQAEYSHAFADAVVEFVNLKVTGIGSVPKIAAPTAASGQSLDAAVIRQDVTTFRVDGELRPFETTFYRRDRLPVGMSLAGPAIILQTDSTTVVPPDCTAEMDKTGSLMIRIDDASP